MKKNVTYHLFAIDGINSTKNFFTTEFLTVLRVFSQNVILSFYEKIKNGKLTSVSAMCMLLSICTFAQTPTITNFTPKTGKPNDLVTLTGTNFNTTAANNIVFFGATRAQVTAATTTKLTVKVPFGATNKPISIINTANNLACYSKIPFTPNYTKPQTAFQTSDFLPRQDFGSGVNPQRSAIGDINGDGKADLITTNRGGNSFSILINTSNVGNIGSGSFAVKQDSTTNAEPRTIEVGDLDNDGKLDLVVSYFTSTLISVFKNTSTTTSVSFSPKVDFTVGTGTHSIAIGDLNADGKADIAVANLGSNSISVLRNTSVMGTINSSSFAASVNFTTGSQPSSIAIGNLHNDTGKPEIVVTNVASNTISIFSNVSSSTALNFLAKQDFTTNTSPNSVVLFEANGDSRLEIAVANSTSQNQTSFSVFRNTSNATTISLAARVNFGSALSFTISVADLDGDGKQDIVASNNIFLNAISPSGAGTVINTSSFVSSSNSFGNNLTIGDLDGDTKPEIVFANASVTGVSVVRMKSNPPPFFNTISYIGSGYQINGDNLSGCSVAYFGAAKSQLSNFVTNNTYSTLKDFVTASAFVGGTHARPSVLDLTTGLSGVCKFNNFSPTFDPDNQPRKDVITESDFLSRINFSTGSNPRSIAVGDIDGDGKSDMVVTNVTSNTISIYRNISTFGSINLGSFHTSVNINVGTYPNSVAIGDLNGDGKLDIVVANLGSNFASILLNNSTAGSINSSSFAPINVTVGPGAQSIALSDLDVDGRLDMAVVNLGAKVSLFRNVFMKGSPISTQIFNSKVELETGNLAQFIAVDDLNFDGKPEIVVAYGSGGISVFRNTVLTGSGSFSFDNAINIPTGGNPIAVAISDFGGNPYGSIVVANNSSHNISLIQNNSVSSGGALSFAPTNVIIPTGLFPRAIALGHLNGDNKLDMVVVNSGSNTVSVFRNTTSVINGNPVISFDDKVNFDTETNPQAAAICDFDGDGKPDIAVTNSGSNVISVLRNSDIPPIITSFSPTSGKPGDIITLTGHNFNVSATNNIVYFGATKAVVTSATSTSVTVIVPVGATYDKISLFNKKLFGLIGYSNTNFTPTYAPSKNSINTGDFLPKIDFTAGANPSSIAFGDLNGDGKSEMVVINANISGNIGSVSVFENKSKSGSINSSSFPTKVDINVGTKPVSVALGDIDRDGKLDIVVANYGLNDDQNTSTVSFIQNRTTNGTINASDFILVANYTTSKNPLSVALGDLDGDGRLDMAVACTEGKVSLFRNIYIPNRFTPENITTTVYGNRFDLITYTNSPRSLKIVDLNGDGKLDLAMVNSGSGSVSVYQNTSSVGFIGSTSFAPNPVIRLTLTSPISLDIADIDGDGKQDLAVAYSFTSFLSVFRNITTTGVISFETTRYDLPVGTNQKSLAIADIDGNSKPDLIFVNSGSDKVSVIRNTATSGSIGLSSFDDRVEFTTGTNPQGLAVGDLDGDGRPDISVTNYGANTVSVMRYMNLAPVITSFSPLTGKPGDIITLIGTNFDANSNNNVVFFGATKAIVTSATTTSATVIVPFGATYGPISLQTSVSGVTGLSRINFTPSYKPAKNNIITSDFLPKQFYNSYGSNPSCAKIFDLDLDGKPDLINLHNSGLNSKHLSISRNISINGLIDPGSFETPINYEAFEFNRSIAIGDIDGDGMPDLVICGRNTSNSLVTIFRNISANGQINFVQMQNFSIPLGFETLAIGDLDGDGRLDIAVSGFIPTFGAALSVLQNVSSPGVINFEPRVDFLIDVMASSISITDIDGDHKPELVFGGPNDDGLNRISVMLNTSTRGVLNLNSFVSRVDFNTTVQGQGGLGRIRKLYTGDIDGDGKTDILVHGESLSFIGVFRNTSTNGIINTNSFAPPINIPMSQDLFDLFLSDIDGDDKPDLVVQSSVFTAIAKNISTVGSITNSSFAPAVNFSSSPNANSLAIGDLNGDGRPDLFTTHSLGGINVRQNASLPPTITDFNPKTGKPGDIITLTGTNFNTTASNNIVYFGATKATVVSATATSATVIVPIGATFAAISLANTGIGLSANSKVKFTPTYTPPKSGISPDDFYSNVDFSTGGTSYSTAIADLDGDGKSDLAVTDFNSNTVSIFQNTSNVSLIDLSSFAAKVDFTTGSEPVAVAIGDLDGDGKPDLVVANSLSNTISIFRNIATNGMINISSFATSIDFPVGTTPYSVAIEDFDGDGKLDIAVVNKGGNTVSVLRNISVNSINFATKVDFTTGNSPSSLVAADLDGDGKVDLAITNESDNSVSILRNISSRGSISLGGFEPKVDFIVGSAPRSIAVGDLDGDNKADLVIANLGTNSFSVLYNMSYSGSIHTQSFAPSVDFMTSSVSSSVTIGDLTGDGKPEIALANNNINTVSVFQNSSNPGLIDLSSFTNANDFTTGNSPFSVAMGDLDGDELTDLVLGGVGVVSVLRNSEKTLFLISSNNNVQNSVTNNLSNDVLLRNNNAVVEKTSEVLNTDMIVYPNPASKLLNVNLTDGELKNSTMTIINVSGKEVFRGILETAQSQVNIENLSMGVYLVKVTNETGFNKTIKFVKQ